MTKSEARKIIGLRETDQIHKDGVFELIAITERQMNNRYISIYDKEELKKELEALKALLD